MTIRLQEKYSILYDINVDLNEALIKCEAKYDKLLKQIKYDLNFLGLNWLKDTPIIKGLKKNYNNF